MTKQKTSLFKRASTIKKKLKILIYGDSGSGKTHFALTFPNCAVIDTEGSTELFEDRFDFDVLRTADYRTIMQALNQIEDGGKYETVVIDPITIIWQVLTEAGQMMAERRAARYNKPADDASMTPRDWGILKRRMNAVYHKLSNMPCNVIVCARLKDLVEKRGSDFIKTGEKPDGEKNIKYIFDIIIKLEMRGSRRFARIEKDRSGRLGTKDIENISFDHFAELLARGNNGTVEATPNPTEAARTAAAQIEKEQQSARQAARQKPTKEKKQVREPLQLTPPEGPLLPIPPAEPGAHWMDDETHNAQFSDFLSNRNRGKGITIEQACELLEVKTMHDYTGQRHEAMTAISAALKAAK